MTETTETKPDPEPDPKPDPEPDPKPDPDPEPKPQLKVETLDDLKRILTIAKGGDPDAIQAVANFMDLKSNIERSYFPDKKTSIAIAQLTGYGKTYFPSDDWDPFNLVADSLSIAFMPYKGFKSNQFVDMTRTQPDLSGLKSVQEPAQRSLMDKALGRGKTE